MAIREILSLIAVEEFNLGKRFTFRNAVFNDMLARGYQLVVSTAATRVVRFYVRMGASILETIPLVGRDLHLIAFDLRDAWWHDEQHSLSTIGLQLATQTQINCMGVMV